MEIISSKKVISADNQQERLKIESWIVGFTDGEGCFSVSILKNKTSKSGWQIFPEFVITQGKKSLPALEIFQKYFECGKIFVNKRYDNHKEHLYRYCVRAIKNLEEKIIPFFQKNQLKTFKSNDFLIFCKILKLIKKGSHLNHEGITSIAKLIETMNRKKKSRFLESSETKRQTK
ncbi:MAG: hypothetical protein A2655_02715 [Candidatus Yanofskybacteria bacterium RIFCSPHIGHO2_01_FULL_43_42]|uniref:Homing endonuclease LAGLIDADG domain-containing protein n=1 Tax=Candidatus Yanofskybacteria bacterium RIFCSPLOWO2_01_FULL_43_22 TaxID=1802695 RepID=A0A1F8GIT7_9BACT|nr:MAG: hypothetical protein A2655_02715 [Candidatus Yanofskybacteria bacterium RIFCSPHIGHO2_01_FULL_43_42]OGN24950.1 MAG: hypothetical protein A3A13_01505 [Candidatus Yanofskybacteria bacterium RIFCSPLOWO2_01_FULL_43_22]